ncbi:MAG: hypothetical protein E2598_07400 [Sphingobium sp.]|nr:hypothetical protein [Sphingobium sp.]
MNWKTNIQVLDLTPDDRLEMICKKCGHLRYLTGAQLLARNGAARLYLDQVEARAKCTQRGCGGPMRMAKPHAGETSGFVGGIA